MKNFENLNETMQETEKVFSGKILHLFKDKVVLPNGKVTVREVIRHIGAVGIVALTKDNKVIIEKQFRYPLAKVITEIPAGKLDSLDEDPLCAAKRELREETGYTAKKWTPLGSYCPAAAYCDEMITLYLAEDLCIGERELDEGEFLNIELVPLGDIVEDILQGKITDGKTQTALLKAYCLLNKCQ